MRSPEYTSEWWDALPTTTGDEACDLGRPWSYEGARICCVTLRDTLDIWASEMIHGLYKGTYCAVRWHGVSDARSSRWGQRVSSPLPTGTNYEGTPSILVIQYKHCYHYCNSELHTPPSFLLPHSNFYCNFRSLIILYMPLLGSTSLKPYNGYSFCAFGSATKLTYASGACLST